MTTDIALKRKLSDMIIEYDAKKEAIPAQLEKFKQAGVDVQTACCIGGTYGQTRIDIGSLYDHNMYESLLKSAWLNLHKSLNLDTLMSAKDQKRFDQSMQNMPEFDIHNIRATFGDYVLDPWGNILRGLAEVFCDLDQSYKSHEKVKIGVDGLPKRIIMSGFGGYSNWGWEKVADVVNALAAFQNKPLTTHWEIQRCIETDPDYYMVDQENTDGEVREVARGFSLKLFKNGNGHMIFAPDTLKDINRALAEYYGEVLADCHEDKPEKRRQSTAVSKDLQYYATPKALARSIVGDLNFQNDDAILEPSCGCGRFMDEIVRNVAESGRTGVKLLGIEVDAARANEAKAKNHGVLVANFLETEPDPKFDEVIMNPPFYGKHYAKHIEHALKFLKEGGRLTAILPVSARYDHGLVDGRWSDLPVGSFTESGTNINTTVLTIIK